MDINGQGNERRFPTSGAGPSGLRLGIAGKPRLAACLAAGLCAAGLVLLASCATPAASPVASAPRFTGAANADFIFRYFSDQVSHVERPLTMEGPFLVACERAAVLKLAADQPRHELALVLLIHYFSTPAENQVKLAWTQDLRKVGYRNIVFLLSSGGHEIDGLPILPAPEYPATVAQQ